MSRKLILRLLAVLILVAVTCQFAVSCADNEASNTPSNTDAVASNDESSDGETERLYPDVPIRDFEGYVFRALYWTVGGWDWRRSKDIYAEEGTGDTIGDAVYKRNLTISENYNVKFELEEIDAGQLNNRLRQNTQAGDDVYTIVCQVQTSMADLIMSGALYNMFNIPYIDLSKPWWDQNSVKDYSFANKLYIVSSDITINDKDGTAAMAFAKQAAIDNNVPNLYEMVLNGTWTVENFYNSYKGVARDLNGDSKMDEEDFWGVLGGRDLLTTFFSGSGAKILSKDENDMPYLSVMSDRNMAVLERLFDLCAESDTFYNHHTMGTDDAQFQDLFEEGHGLYHWIRLDSVSDMRASETDFGILPIPKWDEAQERHYSVVSVYTSSLMSVPSITQDFERTGILLEALAAESKYTLMPAYYDVALKTKFTRDEESSAMLDIIINNRIFDLGDLLNPGGMREQILQINMVKTFKFASTYTKAEKAAVKALDKLIDQIEKLPD
jgi:hypothetical protein